MTNIISVEVARALLQKLGHDDAFREAFQKNPRTALASLGYETPAADQGNEGRDPVMRLARLRGGLASKAKIAAATDAMLATYDEYARTGDASVLAFHQFDFCAE
jgi:putative modified peptide